MYQWCHASRALLEVTVTDETRTYRETGTCPHARVHFADLNELFALLDFGLCKLDTGNRIVEPSASTIISDVRWSAGWLAGLT